MTGIVQLRHATFHRVKNSPILVPHKNRLMQRLLRKLGVLLLLTVNVFT